MHSLTRILGCQGRGGKKWLNAEVFLARLPLMDINLVIILYRYSLLSMLADFLHSCSYQRTFRLLQFLTVPTVRNGRTTGFIINPYIILTHVSPQLNAQFPNKLLSHTFV